MYFEDFLINGLLTTVILMKAKLTVKKINYPVFLYMAPKKKI